MTTPSIGHYTVTHPYGVDEFDVTDTATRNINFIEDVGVGAPGDFKGALGSRVNPFLRWDTGLIKGPDGASYLGDGVTPHAITGSDLGTNFFRIDGPDIGGPGVNTDPDQPVHHAGPGGHQRRRRADLGDLHPQQHHRRVRRRVRDLAGRPGHPGDRHRDRHHQAEGRREPATTSAGSPSPAPTHRHRSQVTNTSDRPPTTVNVTLTDQVVVTQAAYNSDTGALTVTATSSDTATPPTLTALGFGALTAGTATFDLGADQVPPGVLTVTSSKSGSGTAPVVVSGAAIAPDPVTAQAPATLTVQQGQQVQLDGSASLNATGFSWAQVAGTPAVTLTNANTSIASFTAPATTTTLSFRLTVQGPGGPKTTDEVVSVAAIAPPRANAGPAQSVLAGSTVTLDGSGSTGASSFLWRRPVAWQRRCPARRSPSRPSRCRTPPTR